MSAPIKKRGVIAMGDDDDDDAFSECPSFDSPGTMDSDGDDGDDYDDGDGNFEPAEDNDGTGSTFQIPTLRDSQEDAASLIDSPAGLATQPTIPGSRKGKKSTTTKQPSANKKRKVSMSPRDSLARQSAPRTSPRLQQEGSADASMFMIDNDQYVNTKHVVSATKSLNSRAPRISMVQASSLCPNQSSASATVSGNNGTAVTINTTEKASLKTTLFPNSQEASGSDGASEIKQTAKEDDDAKLYLTKTSTKSSTSKKRKAANEPTSAKQTEEGEKVDESEPDAKGRKSAKTQARSTTSAEPSKLSNPATKKIPRPQSATEPKSESDADKTSERKGVASENAATTSVTSTTEQVTDSKPPSKKNKKKKRSFQDQLLELLFMSCKPYTVKTLAQELKTNESSINFCMLSLVDKGWVIKKEFTSKSGNRSKELYWANQEAKAKELMDALNVVPPHQIEQAKEDLRELQRRHVSLTKKLTVVQREISNDELNSQLQDRETEVAALEKQLRDTHARIQEVRQGGPATGQGPFGKSIPTTGLKRHPPTTKPVFIKRLKKQINDMRLQWKKRKEKCMDFIEQLADGMEKKVKDVVKLLELETDEMEGVKIPPKHDDI